MVSKKAKISKILSLILIILFISFLSGCNDTIPNEDSVTLYLSENYQSYVKYDEIPSFKFEFEGTLNTIENVNKPYYTVFSNNDDIILSNAISELFEQYKDDIYFTVVKQSKAKTRKFSTLVDGKVKNIDMVCDNEEVFDEVAYIALDNGLKLTADYCRFVSEGKTYYTWRYTSSIAMYLYYPVMKIKNNEEIELALLTLPNVIRLHVSPELRLSNLINKDEYLDGSNYVFEYFDDCDDKKQYVIDYYQDYNYQNVDEKSFTFDYLNNRFLATLGEQSFKIEWVERLDN